MNCILCGKKIGILRRIKMELTEIPFNRHVTLKHYCFKCQDIVLEPIARIINKGEI